MDFTLSVNIDTAILPTLIDAGYQLCIAKKVNNQYTVVWQGSNVLPFNQFTWSSKYQVFGSVAFKTGAIVKATTNVQNIQSGQTATLDQYGIMRPAAGRSDDSGEFTVQNNYGLISLGVNSYVNGDYAPSYVSANPVVAGPTILEPIETVLVWFDTQVTTGTMILNASSQAIEVDFTGIPSHTLLYRTPDGAPAGRGVWYLDSDQALLPMTYHLESNSFSIPEPDDGQLALMTEHLNSRPRHRHRTGFTTPVVAAAEYESEEEAVRFKEYVTARRPKGFALWEVSQLGCTVSVKMEVDVAIGEEASVRGAMDKYLEILYGFDGPRYKALVTTVKGRREPFPVPPREPQRDVTTGTAIVRFNKDREAAAFAKQVNDATSRGIKFEATARGHTVTIKFETKGYKDGAHKRVNQAYDAAIAAFEYLPGGAEPVYKGPIVWDQ